MKRYRVDLSARAKVQLQGIYEYIADRATPETAARYVEKLAAYCDQLTIFPHRGTLHDDIVPGLRAFGFRKQATIVFVVGESVVTIMGIYYGGQDWAAALRDDLSDEDPRAH